MMLEIDDNKTVEDLQDKFTECFPCLKLEFYTKGHGWFGRSVAKDKIDASKKIGAISKKHCQGILIIQSKQKVGLIEKAFKKGFGLFVQVCYQARGQWIETRDTDSLTLQQLSLMAEQEGSHC